MTSTGGLGRSRSLRAPDKTFLKTATPPKPSGPSYITLFLTNLRFLNYDLRDDWPGITADTFSIKPSLENQKRRIESVEWVLYNLFALWDSRETADKLQPFFPPLDPLQSRNLRAALYRCLEGVKKSGVLGRDTILRRTMLDECKGERLEEVLYVFSTAVLKKEVQEAGERHPAIAQQLAMENSSYQGERAVLSTLVLAHKASLCTSLMKKTTDKVKYEDFASLLRLKDRQIVRRHEQLKVSVAESQNTNIVPSYETRELQQSVQRAWAGSSDWCQAIVYGSSNMVEDGVLDQPYDKVWQHVERGSLGEVEDQQRRGLLEQLDIRVREQRSRLAKWQSFESKILKGVKRSETMKSSHKQVGGLELTFGDHQQLQLSSAGKRSADGTTWQPLPEYRQMIEDLNRDLAEITQLEQPFASTSAHNHVANSPIYGDITEATEPLHDSRNSWVSENHDSTSDLDLQSSASNSFGKSQTSQLEPTIDRKELTPPVSQSHSGAQIDIPISPKKYLQSEMALKEQSAISITSTSSPIPPESIPSIDPAAAEILASMQSTSPSPAKARHTLSLAERTRLSMASVSHRHTQFEDLDDFPDLPAAKTLRPSKRLTRQPRESTSTPPEPNANVETIQGESELSRRTRLSISNMETLTQNAQLERRRSLKAHEKAKRQSFMPKRLETNVEEQEEPGSAVKKLMEMRASGDAEIDYESVFMSRPKIKASPPTSPVKSWTSMGGDGQGWGRESEGSVG